MYSTAVPDRLTRSCSLHPASMKVSDEPPGNHLYSPVAKPSKKFYSLWEHNRCCSNFRNPASTCYGVVEVSLKKIYADLLGYLFDHSTPALTTLMLMLTLAKAREFFKNNTVDGARIWTRLGHQVTICLATPNGWETSQQVHIYRHSMTITWSDNDT